MRLDKLTRKTQEALAAAQQDAVERGNPELLTEHLLLALLSQSEGVAAAVVRKANVPDKPLAEAMRKRLEAAPRVKGGAEPALGRRLRATMSEAWKQTEKLGDEYTSAEHVLLAMSEEEGDIGRILKAQGLTRDALLAALKEVRGSQRVTDQEPESRYEALEKYTRDITAAARAGKIDPVIGRDEEIRRVIQVLARRTKNNPVLIGEPGVGKTAIVEGIGHRIAQGDVPESLRDQRLLSLDLAAMIAGAKYRGEFEDRFKAVLKEVEDAAGTIVLFIDELHTLMGAGASEGAMDAGNMLKPALARGEVRCIGATTLEEYRKHIEKDAAFARRFQPVFTGEPSVEDTVNILRGLRERYEVHHGIRIQDSALVAAATLSDRYISDRFLPDKAIDLMDEAAAEIKMDIDSMPHELEVIERRAMQLSIEDQALKKEKDKASKARRAEIGTELSELNEQRTTMRSRWLKEKEVLGKIHECKERGEQLGIELERAERTGDLEGAARLRYGEIPTIEKETDTLQAQLAEMQADGGGFLKEEVTDEDIAKVVSRWTGVPVTRMLESEREKLLHMEDRLRETVVGQDEALTAVSHAVRRSRAGLGDPQRPVGSFLLLGPTGVGKTELARALADFLFDDRSALIRIDMSEYMEKHAVARLIGAPPGYIGHDEGGQLTEPVRRRPYSIVLFDEVEKAHPDVWNVLLQVLDDGRLTDSQGRTVDFSNTLILMTSNVGSQHIDASADEESMRAAVMGELRAAFRPEFLNRLDDIVVFHPLSRERLRAIVNIQLGRFMDRLRTKGLNLEATDAARDLLAELGYDPAYGARPLKRVIQAKVENPLAELLLAGELVTGDTATLDAEGETLTIRPSEARSSEGAGSQDARPPEVRA